MNRGRTRKPHDQGNVLRFLAELASLPGRSLNAIACALISSKSDIGMRAPTYACHITCEVGVLVTSLRTQSPPAEWIKPGSPATTPPHRLQLAVERICSQRP
eukprot:351518-Chlamydomonas_euryale.AAC.4